MGGPQLTGGAYRSRSGEAEAKKSRNWYVGAVLLHPDVCSGLGADLFVDVARVEVLADLVGEGDADKGLRGQRRTPRVLLDVDGDAGIEGAVYPFIGISKAKVGLSQVQVSGHDLGNLVALIVEVKREFSSLLGVGEFADDVKILLESLLQGNVPSQQW